MFIKSLMTVSSCDSYTPPHTHAHSEMSINAAEQPDLSAGTWQWWGSAEVVGGQEGSVGGCHMIGVKQESCQAHINDLPAHQVYSDKS